MFLSIVFTLLCLSAFVLTDGDLSHVVITMLQKEGRQENEDIIFINKTLSELTGIKVRHARKALDNQQVVLVLETESYCQWFSLTSAVSSRGYRVSVAPLQKCSDYAKELGVNITYPSSSEMERHDILEYFEVTYYDQGIGTDEYRENLKKSFKRVSAMLEEGIKSDCYVIYGHLPVKLLTFSFVNTTEVAAADKKIHSEGKFAQSIKLLQSFRSYMSTCQRSSEYSAANPIKQNLNTHVFIVLSY